MKNDVDEIRELRDINFKLRRAFERVYGIVANTIWGAKKVVQIGAVAASWFYYGKWVAVSVLGVLILVEVLDEGYEKMLNLKAEVAKEA